MARKDLISFSSNEDGEIPGDPNKSDRPLAGITPNRRSSSPVGGIAKTLGSLSSQMDRASELERQLLEGQKVVELDPSQIDDSFVRDRLEADPEVERDFVQQIDEHGQLVPILVRPNPAQKGRMQVAFGHRRLRAARCLNRKVKAVVRELNDEQLVVLQGQENSARTNLSYIERALFAARLEDQKFKRNVIISALKVDRAAVSKMIKLIRELPVDLIVAIGAAPGTGRRKWMELAELVKLVDWKPLREMLSADNIAVLTSDERFEFVLRSAKKATKPKKPKIVVEHVEHVPVTIRSTKSGTTFTVNGAKAPGFDEFLKAQLNSLYADYMKERGE